MSSLHKGLQFENSVISNQLGLYAVNKNKMWIG